MKNRVIDIGNSRFKSVLFAGKELLEEAVFKDLEEEITSWGGLDFQKCCVNFPEISIYLVG